MTWKNHQPRYSLSPHVHPTHPRPPCQCLRRLLRPPWRHHPLCPATLRLPSASLPRSRPEDKSLPAAGSYPTVQPLLVAVAPTHTRSATRTIVRPSWFHLRKSREMTHDS